MTAFSLQKAIEAMMGFALIDVVLTISATNFIAGAAALHR
jgi:hypothetical protein